MKKQDSIIHVSPELKKNLDILLAFKQQVDILGFNCQQIKVVDETSLAVCQQNISKANNLLTSIEDKRVVIKAPYFESGKLIDATAKTLSEELLKGINHGKKEVGEWEKARLAEAATKQAEIDRIHAEKVAAEQKETERKEAIRAYIRDKATPTLQKMYADCTTVEICDQKLAGIEKGYKSKDFFAEYANEAYQLRDNYIELIKAKKVQIESAGRLSDADFEIAMEKEKIAIEKANMALRENELKAKEEAAENERKAKEDELAAEAEKQRVSDEAELNKTKGIRYNWGFELSDIKAVPLDWLTLDEGKVKEWLKINKNSLKDGEIYDGVRFFKRMGVSA